MSDEKKTFKQRIAELVDFFTFGIWSSDTAKMSKFQRITLAALRMITAAVSGTIKNRIPIQAASLSYTTLLTIGPLVAVVIIFSSMVFKGEGDQILSRKISDAVVFMMPAVQEVAKYEGGADADINPKITAVIQKVSKSTTSLGIIGTLTMVFVCLLLCVNMENAFNVIWHAKNGRSWVMRFAFYWLLITFGVVLGIAGMTFLAGSQLGKIFENVPFLSQYATWGTQLTGMGALTLALAMFYKFMPNANVKFIPALIGGGIVTMLLLANNKLSFLYIGKVIQQHNFYGYFAILPIAMFSLFVFWIFILMGSQITYAIQNIDFLANTEKWKRTGVKVREIIALAVFSEISKPFYGDRAAPTLKELSRTLDIPNEIVLASIAILEERDLVIETILENTGDTAYKPSHAPDMITLADFMRILSENGGDAYVEESIAAHSPAAKYAVEVLQKCADMDFAKKTIRDISI